MVPRNMCAHRVSTYKHPRGKIVCYFLVEMSSAYPLLVSLFFFFLSFFFFLFFFSFGTLVCLFVRLFVCLFAVRFLIPYLDASFLVSHPLAVYTLSFVDRNASAPTSDIYSIPYSLERHATRTCVCMCVYLYIYIYIARLYIFVFTLNQKIGRQR